MFPDVARKEETGNDSTRKDGEFSDKFVTEIWQSYILQTSILVSMKKMEVPVNPEL